MNEELDTGYYCTECGTFEADAFIGYDDGPNGVHCVSCGCEDSAHIAAKVVKR